MSPEIWLSGVVCTTSFNPRGLVQSSSENDTKIERHPVPQTAVFVAIAMPSLMTWIRHNWATSHATAMVAFYKAPHGAFFFGYLRRGLTKGLEKF